MSLFAVLDYAAVLVFAITGALVASRAQLDIVGFAFLAGLTALGGGTLRDVLLDRTPFWIAEPAYLAVAGAAAVGVFFTAHLLESRYRALLWCDAFALAFAVVAGAGIARAEGAAGAIVVVMGNATGCFGGLMRDVVANEVPLVLKQGEPYATCALVGALTVLGAEALTGLSALSAVAGFAVTLGARVAGFRMGWRLPVYRPRPPRN
ncbi:trimeric intracellular cation channel family protein [Salipiger mucosus]|uniref:Membrane protein n=1 Tax=Salipiger mucosus DSM 16094 TaxID=1123237 RepID=S9R538_9RHOB|nr:trimeric intracellular cation channel family protein [Salipiger mucosus]EPX87027.1 membrane protein [Salipiger mucosus DSM 16094]